MAKRKGIGFTRKNVNVTIRFTKPYKTVKRTVYFKNGIGTYIVYKGRKYSVSYTQHNNTAYTLSKR